MFYTTKQVATIVNMTVSQIHYYDELGLIPDLHRTANRYREFSENNIIWLKNLKVFVDSGMPLKDIRKLTDLVSTSKTGTVKERKVIVSQHLQTLKQKEKLIHNQIDFMENFLDEYDHL
ncbi:MerR family transcriptional regulator [Paucilactobacillus suebicus]|uniref:Transcription regulator n=1 Tax=Paucilactobacillus suebicus DSM 5007 = KCTC 3549 TaxID=1423807 RepID=A0A0R1W1G0_9LACO|nr:MerR family transcriptional regulator [Paucilactobacillus suebicus]KRM11426.1 transcription regulator [Paucilactobacillus suebicus DSM 5007 = KCTC 3549]